MYLPEESKGWCSLSDQIIKLKEMFPWEDRQNKAFFHGSGTGNDKATFGYEPLSFIEKDPYAENFPEIIEKQHPSAEETE